MRRINFLVFLMLAVCLFAVSAFATTYYVDGVNGSNDNDGLTPETAFATVQYADNAELLQPGDTVIVAAGIYTGPAQEEDTTNARFGVMLKSCNGTAEAPITYKGEPGAIITQRNTIAEVGNKNNWCLNIGVTNVVIDGFEFYGAFGLVNVWGGRYAEVKNCVIHDTTPRNTTPRSAGVYFDSEAYGVVHDCVFYNIMGGGGVAAAIDNQGAYSSNAGAVPASVYYRNVFYDIQGAALMIRGGATNDLFYHNTIVGATRGVYTMAGASGKPAGTATAVNNIFSDVTGATFYAANTSATITNNNNLVYNSGGCTNCTFGASTVNGNPKFGDKDNNDYTLTEGSYAVDLGVEIGGDAYLGNAPDAGAFESPFEGNFIGAIEGTVTRAGGDYYPAAPVRGATITIGETTTTTDAEGKYTVSLPFGDYEISVNDGAATASVSLSGESVTKNFVLNPVTGGNVWYVSPDGDDFEGDGSESNPFASIDQPDLLEIMQPGDTVIVKEGTYTDQESFRGYEIRTQGASAFAPLVYKAQGNVVVDMTDYMSQAPETMVSGIYVGYSGSYSIDGVVIDGFTFNNCQFGLYLRDGGKDMVVTNCTFEDMRLPAEYGTSSMSRYVGGVCFSKSSDSYCHHNIFKNIGDERAQVATALGMPGAGNVAVYNNTFDNTTTVSADWAGAGVATNPFVNNIIMNMSDVALWCESDGLITASCNLFDNCPAGTIGSGVIDGDSNFIGASALDENFVPIAGRSMAIDAGEDVGFPYSGPAPDLGAKEGTGEGPDVFIISSGIVKKANGDPLEGATVNVGGQEFMSGADGSFITLPFKVASASVAVSATCPKYLDYNDTATLDYGDNALEITLTRDPSASGTTYYVDGENGNNENDGLTPETAFATIQYADNAELLKPGDTVIVMPGVYTGPTKAEEPTNARFGIMLKSCNGTADDPITYKGMPGAKMTQLLTVADAGANTWVLNIGVTNVVIDGFEAYGAYGLVNVWGGRYAEVKNCVLHDTTARATTPASAGVYFDSAAYGLVHDCTFYNISGRVGTSTYVAAGIDNQGAYSYNTGEVPASEYHHNLFYDLDGAALMVRGGNTNDLFYNNTVSNASYAVYNNTGSKVAGSSTAVNNIIYGMRTYTFRNVSGGVMTNHDNLVYPLKSFNGCEMGANTLIADPFFADAANKDFGLTYGSPAIDAGVDLGYDFLGSAPDFGAFEFDSSDLEFTDVNDLATLDEIADGTAVNVTAPALAYTSQSDFSDNSVYVGEAERLDGSKFILPAGSEVAAGDIITVKGVVKTDEDGKYIYVTEITSKTAGEAVKALGMTSDVLDNDVLVRVWGKVVSVANGTFVVNNGTGDVTVKGTTTKEVGDFAVVTGVANKTGVRAIEVL